MTKLFFIFIISAFLIKKLITWAKVDSKIGQSLSWIAIEAKLVSYQIVKKQGRFSRFRHNSDCFAYAVFEHDGKQIGCQQISFFDSSHNYNFDWINELNDRQTVTVWHNPERPGENVFLSPADHHRNRFLLSLIFNLIAGLTMIVMAFFV
ncbi:hypothetical protein ACI2KR_07755 [Pseudomonas luteola]